MISYNFTHVKCANKCLNTISTHLLNIWNVPEDNSRCEAHLRKFIIYMEKNNHIKGTVRGTLEYNLWSVTKEAIQGTVRSNEWPKATGTISAKASSETMSSSYDSHTKTYTIIQIPREECNLNLNSTYSEQEKGNPWDFLGFSWHKMDMIV